MHHDARPDLIKPLLISTLFIAAVAAAAAWLAFSARAPGDVAHVDVEPGGKVILPAGEKNRVRGPTASADAATREKIKQRNAYASQLERRYSGRNLPVAATVTGEDDRVFTLRWTEVPNPDQLHGMAHAEPLWEELRRLGFRRVEMLDRRATKQLWYKDL